MFQARPLVLSIAFAIAFAGCALNGAPVTQPMQANESVSPSRALPTSKTEGAVLFVATGSDVYILTYPAGQLIGHLTLFAHALCADAKGNVFIPTVGYQIKEYSHDGSLLQTLQAGDVAVACAVDPVTGNLAVANEGSGAGEVAIFSRATGTPQFYNDPAIFEYGQCGYDNKGNLYVDGTGSGNILAKLPKGSGTFINYSLGKRFTTYGSLQWDGKELTLTNPQKHELYALQLGKTLKVTATTRFRDWYNTFNGQWPFAQTWLQGNNFMAQSSVQATIGLWNYPQGGGPKKQLPPFVSGSTTIYGVVVSVAPKLRTTEPSAK
jgi:hypothetical protein